MGDVWFVVKRRGKRGRERERGGGAILKNWNREVGDEIDQSKAE